jgi:hypothetical protein
MKKSEKKNHIDSILLIKSLLEQEGEYYQIKPEELYELLKLSDNSIMVTKLPKFKGKPLEVMGNLNLDNLPISDLGNIKKVNGNLNINNTNIKNISDVIVSGWINDGGTPIQKARIRAVKLEKLASAQEMKDEEEWNLDKYPNDEEAILANALFEYLTDNGDLEYRSEEESERLEEIGSQLKDLNQRYEESEESDEYNRLYDEISALEEERDELESKSSSIYNLIPKYNYYGLKSFEIVNEDGYAENSGVYTIGDESDMDQAILEYSTNLINDTGIESFNESFLEDYIDEEDIEEYVKEMFYHDISENPDVYFSDDDFELSPIQEQKIEELENYIEELENYINDLTIQQNNMDGEIEDPQEYSNKYDEIQELIDAAETKKDDAQEEIDGIEPNREPTDDMIDDKLNEIVEEKQRYPLSFIKEYGLNLKNFININDLAKGLADADGYGSMNSNNGDYDVIEFKGKTYYIMRVE